MADSSFSKMVKAGKMTYFFDVKEAKNNSKYLTITLSQPSKDDPKKHSRRSINIFGRAANDFTKAVEEAVKHLK